MEKAAHQLNDEAKLGNRPTDWEKILTWPTSKKGANKNSQGIQLNKKVNNQI